MIWLISSRDFPLVSGNIKIENISCKNIINVKKEKMGHGFVLNISITDGPIKVITAANTQ
jgi:hypothetical protein